MSGKVGDNLFRASGVVASAGGGAVEWCSTVKTGAFCAAAGKGYFVNTCGGGITATLPTSAEVGDEINFTDYARTWATACKALTLDQGSLKFQGYCCPNPEYDTEGATVKIVYSDATQGWPPQLDKGTEDEVVQTYNVQYLVVAGGGGGGPMKTGTPNPGGIGEGGGGAGGYRCVATKSFSVTPGTTYPITVGGGGPGTPGCPPACAASGCNSVFSTITSAGGGRGGTGTTPNNVGADGGSGGGSGRPPSCAGSGNVPETDPDQGTDGGAVSGTLGGGGGGHAAAGSDGPAGTGGLGTESCISGTAVTRGVGGGGGAGGAFPGTAGTVNTGNGGQAGYRTGAGYAGSGNGGSGVVIIRRLTSSSCSSSGTTSTCGSDTIHLFTGPGTFVA